MSSAICTSRKARRGRCRDSMRSQTAAAPFRHDHVSSQWGRGMYPDEAMGLLKGGGDGISEWNRKVAAGKATLELGGAKLSAAKLRGANLEGANLGGSDLNWADLTGANLKGAKHQRSSLDGAKLHGASLRQADLSETHLRQANLHGARLVEADLGRARLKRTLIDARTTFEPKWRRVWELVNQNASGRDL